MTSLAQDAALVCTALGVVSAAVVLARSHDLRLTVAVLLEFLLAAGLLRLTADATPRALLTAAIIVALRKLVTFGLGFAPVHPLRRGSRRGS
jgi:hypothetical protein